ncbi:MAG TPA: SLC13 family permease [Pseudomonadales bacterium]|nr:SLC13 family permease [Pseudomonadales bacterium]
MTEFQIGLTLAVFGAVILAIAFDVIDMAAAALLGVSVLLMAEVLDSTDVMAAIEAGSGPLLLLAGGMIVAQTLASTGIFDRVSTVYLRATRGSGKRFLLLLIVLVAPLCALLPNATTVVLLAPVIVRVAKALDIDIVKPLIVTAIVSNSAGLLTLVGDPATFIVGHAIGMSFGEYMKRVSLGGLLSIATVAALMPILLRDIWTVQREMPKPPQPQPLDRPGFAIVSVALLFGMIVLFVFGEDLPGRIVPPETAFIAGSVALLAIGAVRVSTVDQVIRDLDWRTLIFLCCTFCLVQAVTNTGLLQSLSLQLYEWFGNHLKVVSMNLLAGVGLLSSVLANTPVVAASITMVKGYLVAAEIVPDAALGTGFHAWPLATLPVFVAMMFAGTLGGNATLIGAAANLAAIGVGVRNGAKVTFLTWLRYGIPITIAQMFVSALYVFVLFALVGRS